MLSESISHSSRNLPTSNSTDLQIPASIDCMKFVVFGGRYHKKTFSTPNICFTSRSKCALRLWRNMTTQTPSQCTSFLCATNFRAIYLIVTISTHSFLCHNTSTSLYHLSFSASVILFPVPF